MNTKLITMQNLRITAFIFVVLMCIPLNMVHANWTDPVPQYITAIPPFTAKAPVIDGEIKEMEWQHAHQGIGLFKEKEPLMIEARQAFYWVTTDGTSLYFAIKTEIPENTEPPLLARVKAKDDGSDQIVAFHDDCFEIWLDPNRRNRRLGKGDQRFYQILANSHGAIFDQSIDTANKKQPSDRSWRVQWTLANKIISGFWHIEIAVPIAQFGITSTDLEEGIGLRIVRNWKRPGIQSDWVPMIGPFDNTESMGIVRFIKDCPVIRIVNLKNPANNTVDLRVELLHSGKQPLRVKTDFWHQSSDNPHRTVTETLLLNPGKTETISITENIAIGTGRTILRVFSADGKTAYYTRKFEWPIAIDNNRWRIESASASAVPFDFGYYPSYNKIKGRIDLTDLSVKQAVTGAAFKVKTDKGSTVAEGKFPPFIKYVSETVLTIPELQEGSYTAEVTLEGDSSVPNTPLARSFVRKKYPWENNTLGISDKIIYPYTPLKISGKKVDAVLRSYEMNDSLLWDSVKSESFNVLAGPMSFEVSIDGKKEKVNTVIPFSVKSAKPEKITGSSELSAGSLKITMDGIYDYDGMLKLRMTWSLPESSTLDQFDLVIPVAKEIAKFIHVCPDFFRGNTAGYLPEGNGIVWESSKEARTDLRGTFVPYVWLGNERQGIAWFADNDKDWLFDDKTSTHTVSREKDKTVLRIRFVTAPGKLKRDRTIIFGMQATPTKPMPTKPMNWRKIIFCCLPSLQDQFNVKLLLSGKYWGSYGFMAYPKDEDYTIFSMIGDSISGKHNPNDWQKWKNKYDPANYLTKNLVAHIAATERWVQVEKIDKVVPYTDVRGGYYKYEFETFQDEWVVFEYTTRKWPDDLEGLGYEIMPVRSRQDLWLYNFNKMFDSGAVGGIYFDCVYLKPNKNTLSGTAYVDDNGTLRPGIDLFSTRDFLKRAAVLAYEKLGYNLNIAHMTSTQIVPLNTWAGINLDWEWKYGLDDFQDRYPRDWIRTSSIGLQTGCIPIVLGRVGIQGLPDLVKEKKPWLIRTLIGTAIVHEIQDFWDMSPPDPMPGIFRKLFDFGYGDADCTVHTYWQDSFPLTTSGADVSALVLEKNGKVFMCITSFDQNDGTVKAVLDSKKITLQKGGKFINAETGDTITPSGSQGCTFTLKKHDFILIEYKL